MKDRSVAAVLNELAVPPDDYTVLLLTTILENQDRALELISQFSIDWTIERMALLDRLILTLSTSEMMLEDAPPTAVILDEAVELAKTYSTDGSPSFVNGVLSSIASEITSF